MFLIVHTCDMLAGASTVTMWQIPRFRASPVWALYFWGGGETEEGKITVRRFYKYFKKQII